ncbi:MAG: penicillin-binding protein 2 [Verrucomicrobiae bacterium]|nr:penicillin-binding protein 2 [Verrucomicrobiae bacterium]
MIQYNIQSRTLVVGGLLMAAFTLLSVRLVILQVAQHDRYYEEALNNHVRKIPIESQRGEILDASGLVLATSLPLQKISTDPEALREGWELQVKRATQKARKKPGVVVPTVEGLQRDFVLRLSAALGEPPAVVAEKLSRTTRYVELKRRAGPDIIDRVRELKSSQLYFEEDFLRVYPNQELASHVLGYVDFDQKSGLQGIESSFQKMLKGLDGWRRIVRDASGRELVPYRVQDVPARNGYSVVLTLDSSIQHIVETELDRAVLEYTPQSAVAIVMRPRTGEILAMANRPTFNPNLRKPNLECLRNRAISDIMEPGSTFKIVTTTAAFNEGIINLRSQFYCEQGQFLYAGKVLRDHGGYGVLDVETGIQKSSNIMAGKIGLELGENRLFKYISFFGFGQRTGIRLPAEARGLVHSPRKWSKVSIVHIPMGHEVAVTPLQMISAFSVIANGGLLMKPMIVGRVQDQGGRTVEAHYPTVVRRVISPRAAEMMNEALKSVVSRDGTAARASVEGFTVAGKTGTAQKIDPATGAYYQGHDGKVVASFIGYLPADNPEFCVLVVLDEPVSKSNFGGQTAAPVFSAMASQIARQMGLVPEGGQGKNVIAVN